MDHSPTPNRWIREYELTQPKSTNIEEKLVRTERKPRVFKARVGGSCGQHALTNLNIHALLFSISRRSEFVRACEDPVCWTLMTKTVVGLGQAVSAVPYCRRFRWTTHMRQPRQRPIEYVHRRAIADGRYIGLSTYAP